MTEPTHEYITEKIGGTPVSVCKNCGLPEAIVINQNIVECHKKKRSIGGIIWNKIKEKPATQDEIEQLKLDHERAELKAGIRIFKNEGKKTRPGFFTTPTPTKEHKSHKKKSKKRKHRDNDPDIDIDDTEKHRYDALIGKRIPFW